MIRFEIRAALPGDEVQLTALARHLNSVNLPAEPTLISRIVQTSQRSFDGTLPKARRTYVFVLRDLQAHCAVGTSSLVGQLGRHDAPYIFFDVDTEERYSRDLGLHFEHQLLRLGFSYDGPTELAGLVVDPRYRRQPGRLGLAISFIRFLFVAAYRSEFQDTLLAELLPPLEPDGTSHLWNALGRRFTNMTYRHADRLSHENKDFISDLFPRNPVYVSLLSEAAQGVIGKVGHQTKGVEKMLCRIGFTYADRVDPFDGGPHFTAPTDQVSVVRDYRALPTAIGAIEENGKQFLVARLLPEAPYLVAVVAHAHRDAESICVTDEVATHLGVSAGDTLHSVPLR